MAVIRFTEMELRTLADRDIGAKWEQLGTMLAFSSAEIEIFRIDNPGRIANAIFKMLVTWQQRRCSTTDGPRNLMTELAEVLKQIGRADLAHAIETKDPKEKRK